MLKIPDSALIVPHTLREKSTKKVQNIWIVFMIPNSSEEIYKICLIFTVLLVIFRSTTRIFKTDKFKGIALKFYGLF